MAMVVPPEIKIAISGEMPHPLRRGVAYTDLPVKPELQSLARCPTPCDITVGDMITFIIQSCNLWRDAPPLATEMDHGLDSPGEHVAIPGEMPHPLRRPTWANFVEGYLKVAISGEMPHPLRQRPRTLPKTLCTGCNLWRDAPPLATKTSNFTENIMHRLQSLARCPTPCDAHCIRLRI